jgi:AcrR family transcriptional regulator
MNFEEGFARDAMKPVGDRRVQKTRKLLQDALVGLMTERGQESITIQEILDRANVGRSTFYTHFDNKQELLHSCFKDFHELFEQLERGLGKADFILDIFRFTARHHQLFKALLVKNGTAMFNRPIDAYSLASCKKVVSQLASRKKLTAMQREMLAHHISGALIGTLKWWIEKDMPCPVEEVDRFFKQLTMNGLR